MQPQRTTVPSSSIRETAKISKDNSCITVGFSNSANVIRVSRQSETCVARAAFWRLKIRKNEFLHLIKRLWIYSLQLPRTSNYSDKIANIIRYNSIAFILVHIVSMYDRLSCYNVCHANKRLYFF
jgi:hypothetical protein